MCRTCSDEFGLKMEDDDDDASGEAEASVGARAEERESREKDDSTEERGKRPAMVEWTES